MREMREILFRGKRVDNGEWVKGYLIVLTKTECGSYICFYSKNEWIEVKVIPKTVGQFTGKTLNKGDKVFEGTIAFNETETDNGDERVYIVCTWIKEWCMFAWLTVSEYWVYQQMGAESLDETLFWTYTLEDSCKYHLAGDIHNTPELINQTSDSQEHFDN
jgi:hypothetical protein